MSKITVRPCLGPEITLSTQEYPLFRVKFLVKYYFLKAYYAVDKLARSTRESRARDRYLKAHAAPNRALFKAQRKAYLAAWDRANG